MKPKEKAKELIKKFMGIDEDSEQFDGFKMGFFYAQRCALIAVDEIIKSREEDSAFDDSKYASLSSPTYDHYIPHPMYSTYWQEVKEQIGIL